MLDCPLCGHRAVDTTTIMDPQIVIACPNRECLNHRYWDRIVFAKEEHITTRDQLNRVIHSEKKP